MNEASFIPIAYRFSKREQKLKDGFIKPVWKQIFMCIATVECYELYDSNKQLLQKIEPRRAEQMLDRHLLVNVSTTL